MKTFEIKWDDLTDEAKEKLAPINNGNGFPIAQIDLEDDDDEQ